MYNRIIVMLLMMILVWSCESSKNEPKVSKVSTGIEESIILPAGQYQIDKNNSLVRWIGRTPVKFHDGTINILEGSFSLDDKGIFEGNIIMDMNSINCTDLTGGGKNNLEAHLKNDDFFSVDKYATSTIDISSDMKSLNGMVNFEGNLKIKNISNPISFKSTIDQTKDGKYKAISKLTFDRSKYNIKYKSKSFFNDLGDKFINDEIEIELEIITL